MDATPAEPRLDFAADGAIGWITIDNPARLNALTADMWRSLPAIVRRAEGDAAVRIVIVRGAGDTTFSSGADISEFETQRSGAAAKAYDTLNHAAFAALAGCTKPTLAMIRGHCLGGALGLALCCDLRLADETAQFAIPAARLGIAYNPRWVRPLLATVSPSSAKAILFTGRRFGAVEAQAMGLVDHVFPQADLENETRGFAGVVAANAPLAVAAAKRAVDELTSRPESADMAALDALVEATWSSEDYAEGRRAFLEKRKPRFQGR